MGQDGAVYAQFLAQAQLEEQLQQQQMAGGQMAGFGGMGGVDPSLAAQRGGFKTKMCNFFAQGRCNKAEGCSYAHGEHEMQARPPRQFGEGEAPAGQYGGQGGASGANWKTTPCKFFAMGSCQKGEACTFSHGDAGAGVVLPQGAGKGGSCGSSYGKGKGAGYGGYDDGWGGGGGGWGMMEMMKGMMGGKGGGMMALGAGKGEPRPWSGIKSKMCNFHMEGRCNKGAACTFAHDESEIGGGKGGGMPHGAAAQPSQAVSAEDQMLIMQMQQSAGSEGFPAQDLSGFDFSAFLQQQQG